MDKFIQITYLQQLEQELLELKQKQDFIKQKIKEINLSIWLEQKCKQI